MDDAIPPAKTPPRRRIGRRILLGVSLVLVALVAAFPLFASSERVRVYLLAKANAAMSPGRLEVERFRFSWFSPTEIDGLAIYDPHGKKVIHAGRAVWGRTLYGVLFRQPDYGLLTLDGLALDIERRADGSIDLEEALRPVLKGTPATNFRIHSHQGTIRLNSPELVKPLEFAEIRLDIDRPSAPGPVSWDVTLKNSEVGALEIQGNLDRWDGRPQGQNDLDCNVSLGTGHLPLKLGDLSAIVQLPGTVRVNRSDRRWSVVGDLKKGGIQLSQGPLRGDTPNLEFSRASWKVAQGERGWVVEAVDVRSPLAVIRANGPAADAPPGTMEIGATLDLVAISKTFPKTLGLRDGLALDNGRADLTVSTRPDGDSTVWAAKAELADLAGHLDDRAIAWKRPFAATAKGRSTKGKISVDSGVIASEFLNLEGHGDLDKGIALKGTLDLAALTRMMADYADLDGLTLNGQGDLGGTVRRENGKISVGLSAALGDARIGPEADPVVLSGLRAGVSAESANPGSLGDWAWSATVDLESASRAGLTLEKARVAIRRGEDGSVGIDSVDGLLNGGTLHLLPELTLGDSPMLRLKSGSTLDNAEVNEEMSRRVLSFANPVLDGASVNRGRVSARIDRAEFPLNAQAKTKAQVEGRIVFQDLEFTPGPIAADLFALIGQRERTIRLDQPIILSIADGRIHQTGLVLPVGRNTRIAIEGDVGFDRSLDLTATVPISLEMLPNGGGIVGDLVTGSQIRVPITGTLSRPRIDREAFRQEMARMGRSIGMKAATRGAAELLFRLTRPKDPAAPPPLTPAERKALRLEKKALKRG